MRVSRSRMDRLIAPIRCARLDQEKIGSLTRTITSSSLALRERPGDEVLDPRLAPAPWVAHDLPDRGDSDQLHLPALRGLLRARVVQHLRDGWRYGWEP